jgi:hypothetical protein
MIDLKPDANDQSLLQSTDEGFLNVQNETDGNPQYDKLVTKDDVTDYVRFVFKPSSPADPILDFNAKLFNASVLQNSAREVIHKMKQAKVPSASVGAFLQKVCAAFGFPTTLANDESDANRVLELTEERARDLSDVFGDQEVDDLQNFDEVD